METTLQINRLSESFGAEIVGLDVARADDDAFAAVRAALDRHLVLVFRGQHRLAPEAHVAFSRRFGPLQVHVQAQFHLPGIPEILVVSNVRENGQPIGLADAGRYWHSDLSYMARPSLGSLLHAKELPAEGGDTLFADTIAAWAALPEAQKQALAGRTAVHDYDARNRIQAAADPEGRPALTREMAATVAPVVHPVVRVHPGNGRPALFVNQGFTTRINGLDEAESRRLLALLFRHASDPRFQYRHRWQPGDLVMWDNRGTQHLATPFPADRRRLMYRTTVEGDQPVMH